MLIPGNTFWFRAFCITSVLMLLELVPEVFNIDPAVFRMLDNCADRRIIGNDLFSREVRSQQHCGSLCSGIPECYGFNIQQQVSGFSCELKKFSAPITSCSDAAVQSEPGVSFYLVGKSPFSFLWLLRNVMMFFQRRHWTRTTISMCAPSWGPSKAAVLHNIYGLMVKTLRGEFGVSVEVSHLRNTRNSGRYPKVSLMYFERNIETSLCV